MAYRDNVSMLASKLSISNDPGLNESDLKILRLDFQDKDRKRTEIHGDKMNKGGRLFFQDLGTNAAGNEMGVLLCDEELQAKAAEYFAELWEDPERGKRKLLDALRTATLVYIHWKVADHPGERRWERAFAGD